MKTLAILALIGALISGAFAAYGTVSSFKHSIAVQVSRIA